MHQFASSPIITTPELPQAGWPTGLVPLVAHPVAPDVAPVTGGGAAPTATRVRWGRLLFVAAGIGLIAFGVWNVGRSAGDAPTTGGATAQQVTGGGASGADIEVAKATRAENAIGDAAANRAASRRATTTPSRATRAPGRTRPVRRAAGTAGAAGATRTAGLHSIPTSPTAAPGTTVRGGGATPGELPYTGLETWIAALLGAMLLAIGVGVHVNAVRIGMTAMLYRRGILLRPIDCARMAQSHGIARLRVRISGLILQLLEEPSGRGEYVTSRLAVQA